MPQILQRVARAPGGRRSFHTLAPLCRVGSGEPADRQKDEQDEEAQCADGG
jgi:hypothetical protein